MGEEHVFAEGLAGGNADHLLLLNPGADAQGAHGHVGRPAGGVGFLKGDDRGALLGGGHRGGQAGEAGGYDDNIGIHLFHFKYTLSSQSWTPEGSPAFFTLLFKASSVPTAEKC